MVKVVDSDKILVTSPAQLEHEFTLLQTALAQPETEHTWENIDKAVKRFQAVVRGGAPKFVDDFIRRFKDKPISNGIIRSLATERTRLSATTLDLLASCTRLGVQFQSLLAIYLPPLLRLLCRTNKLYISRASATLAGIIKHTRLVDVLKYIVVEWKIESGKSSSFRIAVTEALVTMLGAGIDEMIVPKEAFDRRIEDLEWVIRVGATDREPKVRGEVKKCWEVYKREWPERVAQFTAPMTPVSRKYLNVTAAGPGGTSAPSASSRPMTSKPKVPSSLSSSVSAASAPKTAPTPPLTTTSSHRPMPSTSSLASSTSSRPPLPSSRPNPPPTSTTHNRPMPPGALSSTSARDQRLAKSVGYGAPPPMSNAPGRSEPLRSISGGALPSLTTPSVPADFSSAHAPPRTTYAPSFAAPTASSSASFRPTPSFSSAPFKPSVSARPVFHQTHSATLLGANGEVRKARRVAPPPDALLGTASIGASGRSTTARSAGVPFRPKVAARSQLGAVGSRPPSAPSTVIRSTEMKVLTSVQATVPAMPVPVEVEESGGGMKREESAELDRLVALVDNGGVTADEEVTIDEEAFKGGLLEGLREQKVGEDENDVAVDGQPQDIVTTDPLKAPVDLEVGKPMDEVVVETKLPVELVTVVETAAPVERLQAYDKECSTAEIEEAVEATPEVVEVTQVLDIVGADGVVLTRMPLDVELEATGGSVESAVGEDVALVRTTCDGSEGDVLLSDSRGAQVFEQITPIESGIEEEVVAEQVVEEKPQELEEEVVRKEMIELEEAEDRIVAAAEETVLAPITDEPIDAESKEELGMEYDSTTEDDEAPLTVEIEALAELEFEAEEIVELEEASVIEHDESASTANDSEVDEDEGPTFDLPCTPIKSQPLLASLTPEPFAQTCSIMLETPPRFEDYVSMAIRLPGSGVVEPLEHPQLGEEDDVEAEEVEQNVAEKALKEEPELATASVEGSPIESIFLPEESNPDLEDEESFANDTFEADGSIDAKEDEADTVEIEEQSTIDSDAESEVEVDELSRPVRRGPFVDEYSPTVIMPLRSHDDSDEEAEEDEEEPTSEIVLVGDSKSRLRAQPAAPIQEEVEVDEEDVEGKEQDEEEEEPVVFRRSLRSREVEVKQISPVRTRGRREVLGEVQI